MKKVLNLARLFLCSLCLVLITPHAAMAYVGPGAGIVALGALIALAIAIVAALFGFLWFPIKRFLKQRKEAQRDREQAAQGEVE